MNPKNHLKLAALLLSILPASLFAQIPRLVDMTFYSGGEPVRKTSYGAILLELEFDQAMDTTSAPVIDYSLDQSYAMPFAAIGSWVGPMTWQGALSITNFEPADKDGEYQFRIQKAKAENGFEMATTFSVDLNTTLFICRTGKIRISPESLDFGENAFGTRQVRRLVISNESCADLSIRSISATVLYRILGDFQNVIIPPSDSLKFFVEFRPLARGQFSGTMKIVSNDRDNREASVSITAKAIGPRLVLGAQTVDFGEVPIGSSGTVNFVVKNDLAGNPSVNRTLVVENMSSESGLFTVSPSSFSTLPGKEQIVRITFSPQKFTSYDSVKLNIVHNDSSMTGQFALLRGRGIDTTPPAPLADLKTIFVKHEGLTRADSILICWKNPPDHSGIAEILWKFTRDQAPPRNANDTTTQGGRARLNPGQTCAYLPLKDRLISGTWNLYVWLADSSGNSGFQNWTKTQFTYDILPPETPKSVARIVPATSWFNQDTPFLISYSIPIDPAKNFSDASELRYKFQTPPVAASDTSGALPIARPGSGRGSATIPFTSDTLCGVGNVYFWFADSAGNSDHTAFESFEYRFDGCAPTVQGLTNNAAATAGSRYESHARVEDHSDVDSVWVFYRQGGKMGSRDSVLASRVAHSDSFLFRIPAEAVTRRGLEVAIVAKDTLGNQSANPQDSALCSNSGWLAVATRMEGDGDTPLDEDGRPIPLTAGFDTLKYQLFSVPHLLDGAGVLQVFEDDLAPYNDTFWRIFDFVPQNPEESQWREGANVRPFTPGRAYFLISRNTERFVDSGPATTVSTICPFQIRLYEGWNLFGLPFNFNVAVSALEFINAKPQSAIYGLDNGWRAEIALQPWKGYAVFVERAGAVGDSMFLSVSPDENDAQTAKSRAPMSALASGEWSINLRAQAGSQHDDENWLGMKYGAKEGYDELELAEPPFLNDFVSLSFERPEWEKSVRHFSTDFRPENAAVQSIWTFSVRAGTLSETVEIEFEINGDPPPRQKIFLLDETAGIAQNLRQRASYRIPVSKNGVDRALKIVVGDESFVEESAGEIALAPDRFELLQNYPNPFNPETVIRYNLSQNSSVSLIIYDQLGRQIRELVNSARQEAGYFTEIWDGRDNAGRSVVSGLYFYRLITPEQTISRKMVLLR